MGGLECLPKRGLRETQRASRPRESQPRESYSAPHLSATILSLRPHLVQALRLQGRIRMNPAVANRARLRICKACLSNGPSSQKERRNPMEQPEQPQRQNKKQRPADALPGSSLEALLPDSVPGYERRSTTLLTHRELKTNEVSAAYSGPSGSTLTISIADLGNQPELYKNFLTGGGLRQSPFGNSF